MLWVNLIPILLIVAVLLALPALSRPTVPLGVSVPTTRLHEPVVHRSMRRYRIGVLASGVVVVVALVLVTPGAAAVADNAAPFVLLVAGGAIFAWARRPIQRAKAAGGWYDGVPVRIIARLTDEPRRVPVAWPWYVAATGVVAAGAVVGAALYDRQPDPYPTHWNFSGAADSSSAKSPLTVFAPLVVLLGVVVFMAVVGALVARMPERRYADGDPEHAERRRVAVQASVQSGLGLLTLLVTLGAVALQIAIWSGTSGGSLVIAGVGFSVLVAAGVLILLVRIARANSTPAPPGDALGTLTPAGETPRGGGAGRAASSNGESPDDDACWRAGIFYVNPDDPSIWVPKRMGVGWTINFGRPAGVVIAVVTVLVIAGLVVVGLLQQQ